MTLTAVPRDETERLALLQSTQLLNADGTPAFQSLARLLSQALGVPAVAINLIDSHRVWSLARVGLAHKQLSRQDAPCAHTLSKALPVRVSDMRCDPGMQALAALPALQGWVAYAGVPLSVEGCVLGTVCAFDTQPRDWSPEDMATLDDVTVAASEMVLAALVAQRTRRSEERVRGASMAGSDWLWETDAEGAVTWVSAGLMQHTGLDPSTAIGVSAGLFMQPRDDDTRASWDRYLQAKARHEPFQDMIADRDTPRGRITVSVSGTPIFDGQGQFVGYRGASRNVTRQLSAEQEARRADQLLRKAIETFHMSVMISDPQGRVVVANRHWRESLGATYDPSQPSWPDTLRRLVAQGRYPAAQGREEGFVDWRLQLRQQSSAQKVRFDDRWLLLRDEPLDDGSTVHFATDITRSHRDAELLAAQRQALHDTEARLSAVLRALPDLWFVIGADDRYVDGHMSHPMLLGTMRELMGQTMGEHLPGDLGARQRAAVARARATGEAQSLGYDLRTRDGTLRHFEARIAPMPGGQALYLTADITDRKLAADKLRVSEELYRSVAITISDGLLIINLAGQIVALNPAAQRILGLPLDAAQPSLDRPLGFELLQDDLITPLPRSAWPISEAMRTGQRIVDRVLPARRADHEIVWLQMSANVIRVDGDSPPFAAMATFRDISKERMALQELASSEERWKFALEGAGDGVWDWDLPSGHMFYSTRWKAMLGHEDHEISDVPEEMFQRVHPQDRDAVSHATMRFVTEGVGVQQVEFRIRHRQGHYLHVLSRGKVVNRTHDGKPLRVVGTHSDITLLKQAEQAQRERALAETASQAKSEFLSRMSHEIRTPLNAITGFAQLMRLQMGQTMSDSPLRNYIDQILHAGRHLSGLVDDVLDLQQVEAGVVKLRLEAIALEGELVQCLSMLLPMAEQREISMSSYIDPGVAVTADRQRLRQVLMNVGSNAIKYNRDRGSVTVRADRQPDGRVCLSLQDSGAGMNSEQLARLYQPFERLGRETSSVEGTGLGLIITRSLVESMGGHMEIDSHPGAGTRVSITLPGATASRDEAGELGLSEHHAAVTPEDGHIERTPSPVPADLTAAASQRPALRVLYVEDNRINALLFAEALRPYEDIELDIAEDGDVAMVIARDKPPHVLVLDAHLPGMSGFEVLAAMRKLPALAQAPAFMCSADAMPEDLARAKQAGFTGYWTKPIDIVAVTTELCRLAQTLDRVAHNVAP